ncbi:ribosomal subunit interface protein [candidate division KSB1 bacterium 4484_188]|nr:MAG: ribosomal subunit interface protein [candidate division KSB1 bacterium 4484_188]
MNLTITARHFKMKDDLRNYVSEKAVKLDRYYDGIVDLEVILGWEKLTRYAELRIGVNSKQIIIKEISDDIRKAFNLALSRAERQLKRYKQRVRTPLKEKAVTA